MPEVSDLTHIRSLLERDRAWAAYALGDLRPGFATHCEWRVSARDEAVVLVYRGFDPPILFALGPPAAVSALLDEVEAPVISLHLQSRAVEALAPAFAATEIRPMWRMVLDSGSPGLP